MRIGKIELTQNKLIIAITGAVGVIALGISLIFYMPLMGELRAKYFECKSVENKALEYYNIIASVGKTYGDQALVTKEGVSDTAEEGMSHAIDELTKYGKSKGIDFIFISPKEMRKEKGSQYKILPVEMEIESTYEQLGVFLGSLDDLEKGLFRVKSFDITPNKEKATRLMTSLVVDIYLSGQQDAE